MGSFRITVFGGSRPRSGDPAYEDAYRLGQMLGSAGFTVRTGGYIGTMEAVSRGANEAGGKVIGVTCDEIESWRKVGANPWVQEEIRFPTIRQRMFSLIDDCDAALALPGGAGTIAEIAVMWNHLITHAIPARPLILIGPGWQETFRIFLQTQGDYISEQDRAWLTFSPDIEAAFQRLLSSIP